jgi:deoxyribose-phosphate aldolase
VKNVVISNFKEKDCPFLKSSTFYQTENNLPNGATVKSVI